MTNVHPVRADFDKYQAPNYAPAQIVPVRGEGLKVWDQQGNEYLDLAGGIAVNCLGHCHPTVTKALHEQGDKLWHVANVMTNEPALMLAKELVDNTFAEKVFFANSGAEANEAAFKLARRYAKDHFGEHKDQIIAFNQGFHGRTFFTVTVGGQAAYSDGFGPKPQSVEHIDFNDITALEQLISDNTCAVVVEPIQGEGGVISAHDDFLVKLRQLCDKHNALLVFDEVQTGMGRTGSLYAYMQTPVVPDILTSAKSLGGGFPVAAMLTTDKIAQSLVIGSHGSTYGGNPLACAVALAVLKEVNKPETYANVAARSEQLKQGLLALGKKYDLFADVRGKGLLIGAQLSSNYQGKAKMILNAALEQGLMILVAGTSVVRFTPAYIITAEQVELALNKLDAAIAQLMVSNWE
ncbi:aspartate aminotransferase family protein [Paraferrimonas sp. SM1919]|uniref:aspartate aminotransferase family protein n=1 Tax=Paraferrimonas sp. SM1919 TaxID=2662263 RepID=UPI0013D686B2|nr:aspartate aminotransferase family protein [Paraferrimonas sp. SM1919]